MMKHGQLGRAELTGEPHPGLVFRDAPLNVYWECTIACGLACRHCRADAIEERPPGELDTEEARALLRSVKSLGSLLVLTGGDPLEREDLFDLVDYGRSINLRMAITPAVTPKLTREMVGRFAEHRLSAMGISLDGPTADLHDGFRQVPGTFDRSMEALAWARDAGLPVQINTTVTRGTLRHLPAMYDLLRELSPPIRRWSLFLLVPTGRGSAMESPSAAAIEELFRWVYETGYEAPFRIGTTEAPHYKRYWIQRELAAGRSPQQVASRARAMAMGVRDGNGVVFVSHTGDVYPAGFLPHPELGNVRDQPLESLYRDAPALRVLRDADQLEGRCGRCEYRWPCGGSRARAYALTGDMMGEDPSCSFEPAA